MDAAASFLNSVTLAQALPCIAVYIAAFTLVLRFLQAPGLNSSPLYVHFYAFVHFSANLKSYVHLPQFAPENLLAQFDKFTAAMDAAQALAAQLTPPSAPSSQVVTVSTDPPLSSVSNAAALGTVGATAAALLILGLSLSACTTQPTLQQVDATACILDASLQPIAVVAGEAAATATGNGIAAGMAATADAPVHTAVQADCAAQAAAAAAASPAPATAPAPAPAASK